MILVNLKKVEENHFPDGTQMLLNFAFPYYIKHGDTVDIFWRYENDEECMRLYYVVNHIKEHVPDAKIVLTMWYVPNARMDRVKDIKEVFTLKWFCKFINDMNFYSVRVLDPHSNVSLGLLDRVEVLNIEDIIEKAMERAFADTPDEHCMIYFPDAGAMKRYGSMKCFKGFKLIYGEKDRDWETGEIRGIKIMTQAGDRLDNSTNDILKEETIIMIDDIIAYGGTFYYSALTLKSCGCKNIYAYATHTENSILDTEKGTFIKLLNDGTVKKLFTTGSIYNGDNEHIERVG